MALSMAALLSPVAAAASDAGGDPPSAWQAIDPARLAEMRGGFQLPSGLQVSFGIERVVHVNGQLVAHSVVAIPDLARITPEQARQLVELRQGMTIQIGEGNRITNGASDTGALIIQNTLDHQDIRVATRIDAGTSALGAYRQWNIANTLGNALIGAAGGP